MEGRSLQLQTIFRYAVASTGDWSEQASQRALLVFCLTKVQLSAAVTGKEACGVLHLLLVV